MFGLWDKPVSYEIKAEITTGDKYVILYYRFFPFLGVKLNETVGHSYEAQTVNHVYTRWDRSTHDAVVHSDVDKWFKKDFPKPRKKQRFKFNV